MLLILITLLLTAGWAYTSWYWYTCNIKGFCDGIAVTNDQRLVEAKAKLITGNDVTQPVTKEVILEKKEEVVVIESETPNTELPRVLIDDGAEEDSVEVDEQNEWSVSWGALSICETPLVWPIEFWKNNDTQQVELLEEFLISRWEDLSIDGNYGQADFEAVKNFQKEFKAEILDPWGVTEPTWFVFRTTVKKINEIACQ